MLWRAKRNAFRRALLNHGVTEHQAREILRFLASREAGGCELVLIGRLTGLGAQVLDRMVPLMGLHNLITIEERSRCGGLRPILWVSPTGHGLLYAGGVAAAPAGPATPQRVGS